LIIFVHSFRLASNACTVLLYCYEGLVNFSTGNAIFRSCLRSSATLKQFITSSWSSPIPDLIKRRIIWILNTVQQRRGFPCTPFAVQYLPFPLSITSGYVTSLRISLNGLILQRTVPWTVHRKFIVLS
jgi:hypothetical protein